MAEPTAVKLKFTIVELLTLLDDELHGYKGAFSEAQKIRRINKAKDALWKVLKQLKESYFVVASQSVGTSANEDFFGKLNRTTREYLLPKNFGELVMAEVIGPTNFETLKFARLKMTSPRFMAERFSATQAGSGNESGNEGVLHFDIIGPGFAGVQASQTFVLAGYPPVDNLDVQLWYTRLIPDFTVPKVATEDLTTLLAPYVHELISYATKSLIQQENTGLAERWEKEWRMDLERMVNAADDKDSSTPDTVENFDDMGDE